MVIEDLVRAVEEKIKENRRFIIMSLFLHFPQISWSLLHEIVSDKLKFQKLGAEDAYRRTQIEMAGHSDMVQ